MRTSSPPSSRPARWLALAPLALAVACTAVGLPRVTDAAVERARERDPGLTAADLERGLSLYRTRCSSCHETYLPSTRTPEDWRLVVAKMAPRARLDPREVALVEAYLEGLAATPGTTAVEPTR